jgi:hypothetical protein
MLIYTDIFIKYVSNKNQRAYIQGCHPALKIQKHNSQGKRRTEA